jgi:hypothetical protein
MLKSMGVPGLFWGEAVTTAVFVLNRAPTRALEDKTPYEAWYGHKPAVHFLRTFGCVTHVKVAGGHLRKLDDRSTPMVLIGYEPDTKAYQLYNPATDRVHMSRDVFFEEGCSWNWEQDNTGSSAGDDDEPFVIEYEYVHTRGAASATPEREVAPHAASRTSTTTSSGPGTAQNATASVPVTLGVSSGTRSSVEQELGGTPAPVTPAGVEFVSPLSHGVYEDNDNDPNVPLRFRKLDDVFDSYDELREQELMVAVGDGEPATFEEARREQTWIKAMREEMASIE